MRKFLSNYKFVLILAVIAFLGTFTVFALSRLNNNSRLAKSANKHAQSESSLSVTKGPDENEIPIGVTPQAGHSENGTVSYRGISFTYSGSLAREVKAETEAAYTLESETDTGEGVAPEHIVFKFVGDYASQHESSTFSPKIIVYPIADYKKALVRSKSYVRQFEAKIQTLKRILSEQPNSWEEDIPFLPFGIGASQGFHARMKHVDFQNGKGVLFLTQYNIEPALINNQGLTYTFQGLTDDSVYYISAIFPVTAPILPQTYDAKRTEDYTLAPPRSFRGREYESFEADYRIYLRRLIERLEKLPPDRYHPNLAVLEDLVRSLNIARR